MEIDYELLRPSNFRQFVKGDFIIKDLKPALRPMSDLTKEIEVNGKKVTPIKEILKIFDFDGYCGYYTSFRISFKENYKIEVYIWDTHICSLTYNLKIYNKCKNHSTAVSFNMWQQVNDLLNEWHFDYRGLIEQGLAIDINTLKL